MALYRIPSNFIQGFTTISSLNLNDAKIISERIKNLKVIGEPNKILEDWDESGISITKLDAGEVIQALTSTAKIFEAADRNIELFTSDFQQSFKAAKKSATEAELANFKRNMAILLADVDPLLIGRKAHDILLENKCNFGEARIVTDVRPIFDKKLTEEPSHAVIVHNLRFHYQENEESKQFFLSLDLADLKKLKITIDRAIQKDTAIRTNKNNYKIIDII